MTEVTPVAAWTSGDPTQPLAVGDRRQDGGRRRPAADIAGPVAAPDVDELVVEAFVALGAPPPPVSQKPSGDRA